MSHESIETLLWWAGALHFCQLPAMAVFFNTILVMGPDLARLPRPNRDIVYVMAAAVVMLVLGTGGVVVIGAHELAGGSAHAKALAGLLAMFWGLRALVQVVVYAPTWPRTMAGRLWHLLLSVLFPVKATLYGLAVVGMFSR